MLRASEDRAKESGKRSTSAHDGRGVWEREEVGVDRRREGGVEEVVRGATVTV